MSENTLWNYTIQLSGALRVIHGSGLALRGLCLSRVLVTGSVSARARLRINYVALMDILLNDMASPNINAHQVSENFMFVKMNIQKVSVKFLARRYVRLWKTFISISLSISDSCTSG